MNHFEPVVSAELSRRYERRKEIIRKGTWNASRNGWEYSGDFAGIWAEGHHVVNGVREMLNAFSRWLDSL